MWTEEELKTKTENDFEQFGGVYIGAVITSVLAAIEIIFIAIYLVLAIGGGLNAQAIYNLSNSIASVTSLIIPILSLSCVILLSGGYLESKLLISGRRHPATVAVGVMLFAVVALYLFTVFD